MSLSQLLKTNTNVIVSTGNVLSVSDLRKKAGQKPTDELTDSLRSTFTEPEIISGGGEKATVVTRKNNDLLEKVREHPRSDIKIGAKIFLNQYSERGLTEAVESLFQTLDVSYLDNLILAYHPRAGVNDGTGTNDPQDSSNGEVKEGVIEWAVGTANALGNLKKLWTTLEGYATEKKIGQLGIADLDVETLKELFESSTVHPTITQINLAACCVVPPQLQEYCGKNDIQLLTHSDPQELLPGAVLNDLELASFDIAWTTRYQVHIKCRGVLAAKGFIVKLHPI